MNREPESPLRVVLVQNSAGPDPQANLARLDELLAGVPACDLIALPEVFSLRGGDETFRAGAEPVPGPTTDHLAGVARARRAWVLAGSVVERAEENVVNTSVLLDRAGNIAARYRKLHLFEAHLESGRVIREDDVFTAGGRPVSADLEGWRCGLAVCYDLRFPELFRHYAARGAHLLFCPANFTQRTGRDHWEVLLRARAIENQCFVVAPDQCGTNGVTGVASYGNSMVVGPWGEVLCRGGQEETVLTAELDPAELAKVRQRVPVLKHRRM